MHIAILMANTDESAFAARWPKDGEKFSILLRSQRPDWRFSVFSVKDGVFPESLSGVDGVLITGSPASVLDKDPWVGRLLQLIQQVVAAKIPLFGACFGHQAIALAMGGIVGKNPGGWVLGLARTSMEGSEISLYAAHNEQVLVLPDGAEVLGGNAECPVGAFRIGDRILTTQYHPEMTPDFVAALIAEMDGKLPEAVVARAKASLVEPAETPRIAARIVRFLEG
jgi:GMP synthase-like glutamine amidotransferase